MTYDRVSSIIILAFPALITINGLITGRIFIGIGYVEKSENVKTFFLAITAWSVVFFFGIAIALLAAD